MIVPPSVSPDPRVPRNPSFRVEEHRYATLQTQGAPESFGCESDISVTDALIYS